MQTLRPGKQTHAPGTHKIKSLKLLLIAVLVLLMLIPVQMIMSLISERQERRTEVTTEIARSWGGSQIISGAYILLPYVETLPDNKVIKRYTYWFPESVDARVKLSTSEKKRSIFKIPVYQAQVLMKGRFGTLPNADAGKNYLPGEARICILIKDLKGMEATPALQVGSNKILLHQGIPQAVKGLSGFSLPIRLEEISGQQFDAEIKIKGTEQISFLPAAAETSLLFEGNWAHPSFQGYQSPDNSEIEMQGKNYFSAKWSFNKAASPLQETMDDLPEHPEELASGVALINPAGDYTQTMRLAKYAILFLGLTFGLFFGGELILKNLFHPVQYLLVGFALAVFYTLLLSISEFQAFWMAYLISSTATVSLIAGYAWMHFRTAGATAGIGLSLAAMYSFIYILIQLEDYALLCGSIALFLFVALGMFLTRKINWYGTDEIPVQGAV